MWCDHILFNTHSIIQLWFSPSSPSRGPFFRVPWKNNNKYTWLYSTRVLTLVSSVLQDGVYRREETEPFRRDHVRTLPGWLFALRIPLEDDWRCNIYIYICIPLIMRHYIHESSYPRTREGGGGMTIQPASSNRKESSCHKNLRLCTGGEATLIPEMRS